MLNLLLHSHEAPRSCPDSSPTSIIITIIISSKDKDQVQLTCHHLVKLCFSSRSLAASRHLLSYHHDTSRSPLPLCRMVLSLRNQATSPLLITWISMRTTADPSVSRESVLYGSV